MEQQPLNEPVITENAANEERWQAYDAVPRAGPAVFAVRTALLDTGIIDGQWIDPTGTAEAVGASLAEVTGQPGELGGYTIIDQTGLGPTMVDEDLTPAELAYEALLRTAGQPAGAQP